MLIEPPNVFETPIRVLVVDDHPLLREVLAATLRRQPGIDVVGEAVDGASAVEQFNTLSPDVTLMDIQIPQMRGIEAIEKIREIDPHAAIVALTASASESEAARAIKAGAAGCLLKSSIRTDLLQTIRTVHAGGRAISAEVTQGSVGRHSRTAVVRFDVMKRVRAVLDAIRRECVEF